MRNRYNYPIDALSQFDVLHSVDPTFRPIPHHADSVKVTAFQNSKGYRVEFLTTNRGSDDYTGKPSPMPALGGAAAEPLRFMDYLIDKPMRVVLLHRSGISIRVPSPYRYAIHKLIIATRRQSDDNGKRTKDIYQASLLFQALVQMRHHWETKLALEEAWERGPSWKEAIAFGASMMPEAGKAAFEEVAAFKI